MLLQGNPCGGTPIVRSFQGNSKWWQENAFWGKFSGIRVLGGIFHGNECWGKFEGERNYLKKFPELKGRKIHRGTSILRAFLMQHLYS